MCGICGFVGKGTPAELERMTNALAHRGPDAAGFWNSPDGAVRFGHRRLSILDHTSGGQPMRTIDGDLTVVFNGEIYNFQELRTELTSLGHVFASDHSDTEVLLHGYREWGSGLPAKCNGMWAFVLHDRRRRLLFASRDRFGKKPLYYYASAKTFAFASELSALRQHSEVRGGISPLALKKYFAYGYIPAPHSLIEGVRKLPAGHSMVVDLTGSTFVPTITRYWQFVLEPFSPEQTPSDPEAVWGEELRTRLRTAVQRRLVADVPVGVFLSGGVDSSAVAALAAPLVAPRKLQTYSIGFEEPSFDESPFATRVAQLLQTEHHLEMLSISKAHELLPEIAAQLDEPMGDSSLLPCYLLSRFARTGVKVALGGDAGDELFAGYDPFRALRKAQAYHRLVPKPLHQAISLLAARMPVSHRNMSLDFKIKRTLRGLAHPPRLWLPVWMSPLTDREMSELFSEPIDLEEVFSEAIQAWDSCAQPNLVDRTIQFYVELYLQDDILVKVDRATMMHGLEARSPFLDIDFVNFARRIPWQWKLRQGQTKYLLKKALEPLLPPEILYRKKKGFGVPIGSWFSQGQLRLEPEHVHPALSADFVGRKWQEHRNGASDQRAFLWNAWILSNWGGRR